MRTRTLRTVLYVDDEADIRTIVQIALSVSRELEVHVGESGLEALTLSRQLQPDVLMLDVMMPDLDGVATLKMLRLDPQIAHIPVIFVTAKATPREVAQLRALGALGVIAKPFDPMKLIDGLRSLWSERAPDTASPDDHSNEGDLASHVTRLGSRFLQRTGNDTIELRSLIEHAYGGDPIVIKQIELLAHKINGTGSIFGYAAISTCASDLERLAVKTGLLEPARALAPQALQQMLECTERLAQAVKVAEARLRSQPMPEPSQSDSSSRYAQWTSELK
jgi:CheY-like chemotaxis protein